MNGASGKQRGQELPGVIPVDEEVTEKSGGKTTRSLSRAINPYVQPPMIIVICVIPNMAYFSRDANLGLRPSRNKPIPVWCRMVGKTLPLYFGTE